jgi:hypothetical protein
MLEVSILCQDEYLRREAEKSLDMNCPIRK